MVPPNTGSSSDASDPRRKRPGGDSDSTPDSTYAQGGAGKSRDSIPDDTYVQSDGSSDAGSTGGGGGIDGTYVQRAGASSPGNAADTPDGTYVQGGSGVSGGSGGGGIDGTYVQSKVSTPEPSKPSASASSGGTKIFAERFEVEKKLGEGGMGVVYRAKDRHVEGRQIALKILRPRFSKNAQFRELFFKEIHAAQRFVSEHVVQVRDTGKSNEGTLFLTMDLVDGEGLDETLARESSLQERHALEIARQTLLALASGHEQGFVHRDVKPSNVMMVRGVPRTDDNPFGVDVKLLDFGIAGIGAQIEEGQVIGTPRYMSPEQVQGKRIDARSDLFSVAVMLYEMLSGMHPFDGTTVDEIRTSILQTNVSPLITELDGLSDPIRKILKQGLQKDRSKRFQSADDFIRAIERSKAFKERRGAPKWVAAALVASLGANAFLGYSLFESKLDLRDLRLKQESGGDAGALQARLERANEAMEGLREEKQQQANWILGLEGEKRVLNARMTTLTEQRSEKANTIERLQGQLLEKEEDIEKLNDRLLKLEAKDDPDGTAASFFDDIVNRLERDGWLHNIAALHEAGRADEILIGHGRQHVAALLQLVYDLDTAKAEIERADSVRESVNSGEVDALRSGLDRMESALGDLDTASNVFADDAQDWLDELNSSEVPGQKREERLAAEEGLRRKVGQEIVGLRASVDDLASVVSEQMAASVQELEGLSIDDDLAALTRFYSSNPGRRAEVVPIFERLGADFEAACVDAGRLDVDALAELDRLVGLGEFLDSGPGAGMSGDGIDSIRLLAVARRYFDEDGAAAAPSSVRSQIKDLVPEDDQGWRRQFAFCVEVHRQMDRWYRRGRARLVVTRLRDSANAGATTSLLEVENVESALGSIVVTLEETPFDPSTDDLGQAMAPTTVRIDTDRGVLRRDVQVCFDRRSFMQHGSIRRWSVADWVGDFAPIERSDLGRQFGSAVTNFDEAVGTGIPCAVYQSGGNTFWVAPDYGLVRWRDAEIEFEVRAVRE